MRLKAPIIIGGTGGSGTRAVQTLFEKAGFFMGSKLNDSKDYIALDTYLNNTIPSLLDHTHSVEYALETLPAGFRNDKIKRLRTLSSAVRDEAPEASEGWGWKHPRAIYLLPLLLKIHPHMTFVHVVRDGRDMALSKNQQQLTSFYKHLYSRSLPTDDLKLPSIAMWQKVNLEATRWASQALGKRYILLRFEELCASPDAVIRQLFTRIGAGEMDVEAAAASVKMPDSVGRFATLAPKEQQQLTEAGRAALCYYGYLPL
jgi:hypothetical protein